ncbi:HTH_48 domain-containing protein [Trichonephila clavipes]|nr:HTH_48 domain-containing protein [Trichonephila clavipes]
MSAADIHLQITEVYGAEVMSDSKVRKWVRKFKDGRTNVHDEELSGQPSVITDDLMQEVEAKIRHKEQRSTQVPTVELCGSSEEHSKTNGAVSCQRDQIPLIKCISEAAAKCKTKFVKDAEELYRIHTDACTEGTELNKVVREHVDCITKATDEADCSSGEGGLIYPG